MSRWFERRFAAGKQAHAPDRHADYLALFPDAMRRMMERALALPPEAIRLGGLTAAGFGVILVWLARG
mgnify:CR=1 FL=1